MDIISVNTFWTIWLLVHLMLAVALIGALTHQAVAVMMPVRQVAGPGGFVTRFRAVPAAGYATAVCVLWVLTFIVGSYIYTKYRIYVRIPIEQAGYWKDSRLLRFQGACRVDRPGAPSSLLVLLEERPEPGIRHCTQNGDRVSGRHVLVPLYRRPCPQQYPGVRIMSMPTATTRATRSTSSLASSTKFKTFAITFAVVGSVTYLICLQFNWPLFTFHPATNRIAWDWEAGPGAAKGRT